MKSTALKFGRTTKAWLALFYGFAWVAITGAGIMAGAGFFFLLGMVLAASHLTWQVLSLDIDNAENCLVRFRANRDFGLIVFAAIVLDMALAALI